MYLLPYAGPWADCYRGRKLFWYVVLIFDHAERAPTMIVFAFPRACLRCSDTMKGDAPLRAFGIGTGCR
jgi:hypothetical protein